MNGQWPKNDLQIDRRLYVEELQQNLRTISQKDERVPPVGVDGIFGCETAEAVKAAQKCAHLPESGSVDYATWNAVAHAAEQAEKQAAVPLSVRPFTFHTPPLCEGEHNEVVPFAKSMFCGLCHRFVNFKDEPPTDEMTAVTCQNVREIQRVCGQPPTGVLDEAAWNALANAYNLCAVGSARANSE